MVSRAPWRARDVVVAATQGGGPATSFSDFVFRSENYMLDTIMATRMIRSGKTLALIPLLGIRIRPPTRQRKNKKQMPGGDQYEKSDNYNCGSLRQSGPRPDPRLLCQAALEALTRSARTNTPRKTRPEQFPAKLVGGGGGGGES
ncbi:phospho-2-dehydro-3-deoxyheptonate aldolase 2, chloroplastic [Dorcoceras hygrometricum]|uniref:Phospho-2-dehydro-3-deoxyheptonate aldolase 2, chloroplastic n=1 Tax=Dorcoceras hygrometricum TaxID=472368 RepID=A0A2Z7A2H6_9LAMI|nr:phospho-2-dehydro-3-deoxyheptonate aldolase 2, chloroplastic [Dorcoceras hygrometricum]